MKNDDVKLIRRILDDDQTAFAELVGKYQKSVHALAWRKTGDFHTAEDITQDVFLIIYQRLHTLKDPKLFSGWVYVITTRLCATWIRKNRIKTQPLEETETTILQKDAYSQHVAEERAKTAKDGGKNWRTVIDTDGTNLIMEHLAVDGASLYGITNTIGVYRLESGSWEQIVSEIPNHITSLAIEGNTLYVGTANNGMLHFNLEK